MNAIERSQHAGDVWRYRERAERAAAARFRRLEPELARSGARDVVVALARKAAHDELRHAEICLELAARFGVRAQPCGDVAAPALGQSGLTERERVLYEVIATCCVTETISAAALGTMLELAEDRVLRRAVHGILRDEVEHARLGWAHLAAETARGARRVVADYLPAMLEETAGAELFSDGAGEVSNAACGALDRSERRRVFAGALYEVVFPGLERFGIDTSAGARWLADILS